MRTLDIDIYYILNNSLADRRKWLQRAASVGDANDTLKHAFFLYYAIDEHAAGKREFTKSVALGHIGAADELKIIP